ncbi:hypothetical protein MMC34_008580 [Xylographa carneopallida]|nr:hypothetical protein [Xylographa carneopallida]
MSLHFDSFELDYLQPLSFHSSTGLAHGDYADECGTAVVAADSPADVFAATAASVARRSGSSHLLGAAELDDESLLDAPSSPFLYPRDLTGLVSPSPAPSSTSCGSSGDSLYDSDELSSLPSSVATAAQYGEHEHDSYVRVVLPATAGMEQDDSDEAGLGKQQQRGSELHFDGGVHGYSQAAEFNLRLGFDGELLDADMEWELDECDSEAWEEEEEEEETATPALAAVPRAPIVQATVADPAFVPNPAFANLCALNPHTAPAALGTATATTPAVATAAANETPAAIGATAALRAPSGTSPAVEQSSQPTQPTQTTQRTQAELPCAVSPPTAAPAAASACSATDSLTVKPKRKYTRRAKAATATEPTLPVPAAATDSSCCNAPPLERVQSASNTATGVQHANDALTVSAPASTVCVSTSEPATVQDSSTPTAAGCASSDAPSVAEETISSAMTDDIAPPICVSGVTVDVSQPELRVSVASPATSPSSSPASSPRSVVSTSSLTSAATVASASAPTVRQSLSFSLASLPSLPPPGKPGRKRKTAAPTVTASGVDGVECGSRAEHSDGSADSGATDGAAPSVEGKRMVRLQRNRASAQLSRERRKRYMGELELKMKQLLDVNHTLESQLSSLAVENAELKKRLGDESAITPAVAVPAVKKRAKWSRGDGKRSASGGATVGAGTGRTALLMFGIFISFALFYNLVGIEFAADKDSQLMMAPAGSRSSSPTYTPPFAGRLLQSLRDRNPLLPDDVAVKKEPLAIEPPRASLSQPPAQPQPSLALVAVDSSADNRALVVQDEHGDGEPAAAEHSGRRALYEPAAPYRTHNVTSEPTAPEAAGGATRSQYMLCADATPIQPVIVDAGRGEKRRVSSSLSAAELDVDARAALLSDDEAAASRTAKRLRKSLGLPAPLSPSALAIATGDSGGSGARASLSPKVALHADDQLLLWLPSAQLQLPHQQSGQHNGTAPQQVEEAAEAGMVQVRCQVQSLEYVSRA